MRLATRTCRKCEVTKPLTSFPPRPRCKQGRGQTCTRCKEGHGPKAPEAPPQRFHRVLEGKRYIITAAQNSTPVEGPFFEALKVAAKHMRAELVVIPLRYKNPTSQWTQPQERAERWDPAVEPYLFNQRKKLNANLVLVGDVKTQPTASAPLSGFESLTGSESCVIGHTKMAFRSVPVPTGRFPKILTTTGACTKKNFTDSKAGKLGAFHHFLGAIVVEIESEKKFHIRQLNADRKDGSFIDLDKRYSAEGITDAPPALGLVMGDTHARFTDPKVDRATFGPGGMVEVLNPETLVFHDVIDGYATNPHHVGNPFISAAKGRAGFTNVRAEVEDAVEFVAKRAKGRKAVIVSSNHDNFLSRWIINSDWKHAGANAAFYLETAQMMLASVKMTPMGTQYADPFIYWVKRLRRDAQIHCLEIDESFKLGDIECGLHGHQGPNGARGTIENFARLGARVISGHGHTPGIEEGHYRVGTSTPLRLEYSRGGPSSWLNTHCVTYANSKRALITVVDGTWRLE